MLGLRRKMLIGYGGLLLIIMIIGMKSMGEVSDLGGSINAILKENYRSVLACQQMKEALERIDDAVMPGMLECGSGSAPTIEMQSKAFEQALGVEINNITIPGEERKAGHIKNLYKRYHSIVMRLVEKQPKPEQLKRTYVQDLQPLFLETKDTADAILNMNQQHMYHASERAQERAAKARRDMSALLLMGTIVTVLYMALIGRWILRPISLLTQSVDEIRQGNLDLVVKIDTKDEIGRLSDAFNEMIASLRQFRRQEQEKVLRIQRSAQQTFNSLPYVVALMYPEGLVDMATESAAHSFGLKHGVHIDTLPFTWLKELFHAGLAGKGLLEAPIVQHFIDAEEHFFQPTTVPILDSEQKITGLILIINDVTQQLAQDELKHGFISTVSHQLKTPLTSLRMALHILLEEKIGPLKPKQADLLLTAREDSDRLYGIIESMLDISRIESGKIAMEFRRISARQMVHDAVDVFRGAAKEKGVRLQIQLPGDLPDVTADTVQIGQVFANLLSNALKYTPAGGEISIFAETLLDHVWFIIADSGRGIPADYLPFVFDRFFRVPGQENQSGTGLGLAIVKDIVQAHGGTVKVESTVGKGSTFMFTLPLAGKAGGKGTQA